jgi:dUTPase
MFRVLDEVCTPTKGSKYSACIDLYAREDVIIGAGETVKVPLGVCIDEDLFQKSILRDYGQGIKYLDEYMSSHYLQLEPRSSLRAKGIQAGTGIIDLDYKDEIMIILHNSDTVTHDYIQLEDGSRKYGVKFISKGDKIAQIMLCEHKSYLFGIESKDERVGGFGSTGL